MQGPLFNTQVYGIPRLLQNSSQRVFVSAGKVSKGIALHQHVRTWVLVLAGRKTWYVAPPQPLEIPAYRHASEHDLLAAGLKRCTQNPGEAGCTVC